jgi:uncharacterized protein (UPF0333 family)
MVRAQFTMEFMLLFAIAFLIFLVSLTLVIDYVSTSSHRAEQKTLNAYAESIRKDIMLAYESGTGFNATLEIPSTYEGSRIEVAVDEGADMLIIKSTLTNKTVVASLPDVAGSLETGCNRIWKNGGVIQIDQEC